LRALALLFLSLRAQAANIYMVFFGCYNLLLGYLIFRSIFLPRIVGVFRVADYSPGTAPMQLPKMTLRVAES
jgi:putative effector of murein hydrolase LrgA (UPF0299 family)